MSHLVMSNESLQRWLDWQLSTFFTSVMTSPQVWLIKEDFTPAPTLGIDDLEFLPQSGMEQPAYNDLPGFEASELEENVAKASGSSLCSFSPTSRNFDYPETVYGYAVVAIDPDVTTYKLLWVEKFDSSYTFNAEDQLLQFQINFGRRSYFES